MIHNLEDLIDSWMKDCLQVKDSTKSPDKRAYYEGKLDAFDTMRRYVIQHTRWMVK